MINNIHVVDMHTGGEPVRIIVGGYPKVYGQNILEKRRYVRENLDPLRKLLMHGLKISMIHCSCLKHVKLNIH